MRVGVEGDIYLPLLTGKREIALFSRHLVTKLVMLTVRLRDLVSLWKEAIEAQDEVIVTTEEFRNAENHSWCVNPERGRQK